MREPLLPPSSRSPHLGLSLLIALLLYALALAPRLIGVTYPAPQPDELRWRERSHRLLSLLREGEYGSFTSHLGHPGIPPAMLMGAAQYAAERYNNRFEYGEGNPRRIDQLSASRLANASVSALIAPMFFLLLLPLFGYPVALLGAIFVASDAAHIAASRQVHLDSLLTLFVFLSVAFYGYAVLYRSTPLKLMSGVFFGLAIATKQTAIALIPAFFLFKLLRLLFTPKDDTERALVTWSDLWAVIIGHVVLAAMFTRLWMHQSFYHARIPSAFADWVWETGHVLRAQGRMIGVVFAVLIAAALYVWLEKRKRVWSHHVMVAVFTVIAVIFVWSTFPEVLENIVRFWWRTVGLAEMTHRSMGYVWPTPKFGYAGLFVVKISTISFLSFLLGVGWLVWQGRTLERHQRAFMLLLLLVLLVWPALLQASPKKAYRYILPVLPSVYAIAALGLYQLVSLVLKRYSPQLILAAAVVLLLDLRGVMLYRVHPNYQLFHNSLSGGLKAAIARGYPLPYAGIREAVEYLHGITKNSGRDVEVSLVGERDIVEFTYRYLTKEPHLRFRVNPDLQSTEYVIVSAPQLPAYHTAYGVDLKNLQPLYSYEVEGVPLTTVYRVMPSWFGEPEVRRLSRAYRRTGAVTERKELLGDGSEERVIFATPDKFKEGYLFFGESAYVAAGRYDVRYFLALPRDYTGKADERVVIRLEFGNSCTREVKLRELSAAELKPIQMNCAFAEATRAQLRSYWLGTVPIVVDRVEIQCEETTCEIYQR